MSKGTVNKAILIGRLGQDPEVKMTPGGATVANFSMATNRNWKGKDGNMQEETSWHRIVAWNRLAEILKEYAHKGSRIYVEGRMQTRDWEDQNGQKRYITEVVAENIQLLDSRQDSGGGGLGGASDSGSSITPPEEVDLPQDDVPF